MLGTLLDWLKEGFQAWLQKRNMPKEELKSRERYADDMFQSILKLRKEVEDSDYVIGYLLPTGRLFEVRGIRTDEFDRYVLYGHPVIWEERGIKEPDNKTEWRLLLHKQALHLLVISERPDGGHSPSWPTPERGKEFWERVRAASEKR